MVLRISLLFLVLAGCSHPGSVLRRAKHASGGERWDNIRSLYIKSKLKTAGMEGLEESWQDVVTGHYKNSYVLGPAKGANGFDGKVVWMQDDAGQVREEQGESAQREAINERYRLSYSFWFSERHPAQIKTVGTRQEQDLKFHVLSIHPKRGREFEMWINAKTGLVDRTVEQQDIDRITVYYSDYRQVEGIFLPYKQRRSNGNTKYDQRSEVVEVKFNPDIAANLFAKPPPPAPDFAFADGKTSVTMPFQLLNNHIYIKALLNGKSYTLLLDTGGINVITETVAQQLGLQTQGAMQGIGVGEKSTDYALTRIDSVDLSGVTLSKQLFTVFPIEDLFQRVEGVEAAGLVGYEIFKRFVVHIDYQQSLLTLTHRLAFDEPQDCIKLPIRLDGHLPSVTGSFDGISGEFHIDTGSRNTLALMRPIVEKHNLDQRYAVGIEGISGWGVGGSTRSRVIRGEMLQLGQIKIPQPIVVLSRQKAGAFTSRYVTGNVGAGILKQFNITFDYQGKVMFVKPNIHYGKPATYDRSGMWINRLANGFEVVDVIAKGPADRAGIQAGDKIVSVNAVPASSLSLPSLRNRFQEELPLTKFLLLVERNKKQKQVELVLRDMI